VDGFDPPVCKSFPSRQQNSHLWNDGAFAKIKSKQFLFLSNYYCRRKIDVNHLQLLLLISIHVRWRVCLTGLPEVAMPHSDMWQDCQITFQHTRPCYAKSSYRSVDPADPTWKRQPGRPRTKWTDQLRRDNNNVPIATLWRQAIVFLYYVLD